MARGGGSGVVFCLSGPLLEVEISLAAGVVEQLLAQGDSLVDGLVEGLARFVLAKKLFAYEKHSYAEAVALDILVVPLAGADLLAVLNWIAAERHSRTVAIARGSLVLAKTFLDLGDDLFLREEPVRSALNVPF